MGTYLSAMEPNCTARSVVAGQYRSADVYLAGHEPDDIVRKLSHVVDEPPVSSVEFELQSKTQASRVSLACHQIAFTIDQVPVSNGFVEIEIRVNRPSITKIPLHDLSRSFSSGGTLVTCRPKRIGRAGGGDMITPSRAPVVLLQIRYMAHGKR